MDERQGKPGGASGKSSGKRGLHAKRAWWSNPLPVAVAVVAVLLVAAGIALALAPTHRTAAATPSKSATIAVKSKPAANCPLTGSPAPGGVVPERPALAIKVDNYPDARPQSGLDQADIVFEEPVEGGITRFVAVFQCQEASLVGPVRSARYPDVGILDQLSKPIFIHAGGIDPIIEMLDEANLYNDDLFTHGAIVQRLSTRYPPYNTYVSTSAAWGLEPQDTTPPAPVFSYSDLPPPGTAVASIHIPFSGTSDETWTWSAKSNQWLLAYSGLPETDATTGAPIAATNVVVQMVQTSTGPWLENDLGGYEVEVDPTSGGAVTVLRNGKAITGTWQRASIDSPMDLVASDGSTIPLQPGNTWVEMVPSYIQVTTAP
ncbi:MAG TPA: DUF3048 domain-containing protein [Acidimicrobiales bacterium]|nr:DUF3048 domain-containing protein [Acidimicrobiales bacterium]